MYKNICYFIFLTIIITFFTGCQLRSNHNEIKKINLINFTIDIPEQWNQVILKGIDSKIDGVVTKSKDTIFFDFGNYSSSINNVVNVVDIKNQKKLDSLGFPIDEMFFSKTPSIDKNQGVFHKEYYYYSKIDNRVAKIQIPKKIGTGITKIFFDSIDNTGNKLSISGVNLDTTCQYQLEKAFKTIRFFKTPRSR